MTAQNQPHPMTSGHQPALWLNASAKGGVAAGTGTGAASFIDVSGNGLDVAQAVAASQPETGVDTINGKNALQFNGAEFMGRASTLSVSDYTVFIVARSDDFTNENRLASQRSGGDTVVDIYQTPGQQLALYDGTSQYATTSSVLTSGVPFQVTYHLTRGSSNSVIRVNGVAESSTFTFAPTGTAANFNIGTFVYYWIGTIGEILIYDSFLPLPAVKWVESYQRNRWATP